MIVWTLSVLTAAAVDWPDVTSDLPTSRDGASDVAVIVGIDAYDALPAVPGADDNAFAWQRYLAARGVPLRSIRLLTNGDATKEAILDELASAADEVQDGGTAWFVYVGHGAPAPSGDDGLLVGSDARPSARSLEARSVRRSEVLAALGGDDDHDVVLVLDACFSGRVGPGVGDVVAPGLQPVIPTALAVPVAATVLSAGAPDQFAGPLPGLGRPAFSYLLLGALQGWADGEDGSRPDGAITAQEAVAYAQGALSVLVKDRRQVPEVSGPGLRKVLGRGRADGPDLLAMAEAIGQGTLPDPVPTPVPGPNPRPPTSPDLSDLDARIRDRECQIAADHEAARQRDAALDRDVQTQSAALAADWTALRTTSDRCAAVGDDAMLRDCRAKLSEFVDGVANREVAGAAGATRVDTACGPKTGLVAARSVRIGADIHEIAAAYLATYGARGTATPTAGPDPAMTLTGDARRTYERALTLANDEEIGDVADGFVTTGQRDAACRLYARAHELDAADSEWTGKLIQCPGPASQALIATFVANRDDETLGNGADALRDTGRTDEACALYRLANQIDPGDSEWTGQLQRCPASAGVGVGPKGAAPASNPRDDAALLATRDDERIGDGGDEARLAGDRDRACRLYLAAHELDRGDAEWMRHLVGCPGGSDAITTWFGRSNEDEAIGDAADVLAEAGQRDAACALYRRAQRLDPQDSEWTGKVATCR